MLSKEKIIEQINRMPDNFSFDELMEKLLFIYKIETAIQQSKNDRTRPHGVVKEKMKKWL